MCFQVIDRDELWGVFCNYFGEIDHNITQGASVFSYKYPPLGSSFPYFPHLNQVNHTCGILSIVNMISCTSQGPDQYLESAVIGNKPSYYLHNTYGLWYEHQW